MDASKENAIKAREGLQKIFAEVQGWKSDGTYPPECDVLEQFLEAAEKRLPSQAAIDKDKDRKKGGKTSRKATKQTV